MTVDISVVIPCYNEAQRLPPTLTSIVRHLRQMECSFDVWVVDDGSSDGTAVIAMASGFPEVHVLVLPENRGKGHAVRTGMLAAKGEIRVFVDADGSTPIEELPRLLRHIADGADIAIGSRYVGAATPHGQPWWRVMWSRMVNTLVRQRLVRGIADPHCGFKAFRANIAASIFQDAEIDGWAFDLEALALAQRRNFRIDEVAVDWRDDSRSKVQPWRDMGPAIFDLLRIVLRLMKARGSIADAAIKDERCPSRSV